MTLEGTNCLNPRLLIDKVQGAGITPESLEAHLLRFEYIDEPKKRPHVSLTFENEDGAVMNLATLIMGLKMRVTWGYDKLQTKPMDIVVHRIRGNMVRPLASQSQAPDKPRPYGKSGRTKQGGSKYSSAGVIEMDAAISTPKLRVKAGNNKSVYRGMRMSDVVRHLALTNNFDAKSVVIQDVLADGSKEPILPEIQLLDHLTVEQFLAEEAYRRGYVFRYHGGQFYWGSEDLQPSSAEEITYFEGPDLLGFEIDGDFRINVSRSKTKAFDVRSRDVLSYDGQVKQLSYGIVQGPQKFTTRETLKYDDVQPILPERKELAALGKLAAYAKNRWIIKVTLVGNPRVFVGRLIALKNFGAMIDGMWRVRGCRHLIDDTGYTTTTELVSADKAGGRCGPLKEVVSFDKGIFSFGFVGVPCTQKKNSKGRKSTDQTPDMRGSGAQGLTPRARPPTKGGGKV
jgi:hypothetical protein